MRRLKKGFLQKQVDRRKIGKDCEGKKGVSDVQRDEFCLISFACVTKRDSRLRRFIHVAAASNLCSAFAVFRRLGRLRPIGSGSRLAEADRTTTMAHWKVEQQLRRLGKDLECLGIATGLTADNQRRRRFELDLDSWLRQLASRPDS